MIEFIDVTKYYPNKIGINKVNFKIEDNDIVIFCGANGSGKTTTIKLILGLLKLKGKDEGKILNTFDKMSYIPERIALPTYISVEDFINDLLVLQNNKVDYLNYFSYLDLDPKQIIGTYSKGMRQKLGIIQAIISKCKCIVLDEPLSGLDSESQKKVLKLITNLKNEKTIIISTHYKELFMDIKTKIILLTIKIKIFI